MRRLVIAAMTAGVFGVYVTPALAQDGAKVYADQKCSTCHSIAGKGNTKGALDDVGSKFTADEIRQSVVRWKERFGE